MDFKQCMMAEAYRDVEGLGDRLPLIKQQINWEKFRPIIASVFRDNKITGGRPHTDEIVIMRCMILQQLYGLSDEELEFLRTDRLSFRNFVGFEGGVPDFTTIWTIRERLKDAKKDDELWAELQIQMDEKGLKIKKGVIQDATFIKADQGRKRKEIEKKLEKIGQKPEYTPKQLAHMDSDGTYAVKNGQVHYGYKSHVKLDVGNHLIRNYEVTTASLHDSQVDLINCTDGAAYKDKGYFGVKVPEGVEDKTMKRGTRAGKLNEEEERRNLGISRVRSPGERPFAVMGRTFHGAGTYVKTLERVKIKEMFRFFAFDLYQMVTLVRRELRALAVAG